MELEREVRYKVEEKVWDMALRHTEPLKSKIHTLDITFGKFGFNSFEKTGKIFRIRQKEDAILLQIKSRTSNNSWLEEKIKLENVRQGFNFLTLAGLDPYLFLERIREVRKFKNLKIFFDDFKLLGRFIEIEFQDGSLEEVNEFLKICKISGEPQALYGDIVKEMLEKDMGFKKDFEKLLKKIAGEK